MDFSLIWKAALIIVVGTALLRISGKKTISEMTFAQAVMMISIGTLLIQPATSKNVWMTLIVAAVIVGCLLLMEMLQVKSDKAESLITGKPTVLIKDGVLQKEALRRVRLTLDQLETRLRAHNVTNINDLRWVSLEPNGKIGFTLHEHAKPATKGDIQLLLNALNSPLPIDSSSTTEPLFTQMNERSEGNDSGPADPSSPQVH